MTAGNWGGTTRTLTWDPEAKLQTYSDGSTPTITYSYDPFGRRIKAAPQSGSATYYFYGNNEGGHHVAEYTSAWQTEVSDGQKIIAFADSSTPPNVTYLAADSLGTTRETVSGAGAPSTVATYYPYGEEGASITSEYKYTSQTRDANKIDHFWQRKYASGVARWATPDAPSTCPAELKAPQNLNRYSYTVNKPTSLVDRVGNRAGDPWPGSTGWTTDASQPGPDWGQIFTQGALLAADLLAARQDQKDDIRPVWDCVRQYISPKYTGICGYNCTRGKAAMEYLVGTKKLQRACGHPIKRCPYFLEVETLPGVAIGSGAKILTCQQEPQ